MSENHESRISVLEADQRSHAKSDDERYDRIERNTAEIKNSINDLFKKWDEGVGRIYQRIETEADIARNNAGTAKSHAEEAHSRVTNLKLWFLSGAGTMLLGIVIFFVAPFFIKGT